MLMTQIGARWRTNLLMGVALVFTLLIFMASQVSAQSQQLPPGFTPLTTENPKANSFGMEGKISAPAPTEPARITAPSGGQNYTTPLITVSGTCPTGLLVEILDNGVMVGSTFCENGSFSLLISLFAGQNDLSARVIDDLGQVGPQSNIVTVFFNNGQFTPFGAIITLTSNYSRRAADPDSTLTWPLQLSGGTGPYAFSIDWGDGSELQLMSQATAGLINISHVYKNAGIYRVTIKVVDANGATGFLQVIAVANGDAQAKIVNTDEQPAKIEYRNKVIWLPAAIVFLLLLPAFWLGRRHEARAMRKRLERDAEMVRKLDQ
jgi:hypothetical protein